MLKPGLYRHYKGGLYRVLFLALYEGNRDPVVVYEDKDGQRWVRALSSWQETVDGVPRFVACE